MCDICCFLRNRRWYSIFYPLLSISNLYTLSRSISKSLEIHFLYRHYILYRHFIFKRDIIFFSASPVEHMVSAEALHSPTLTNCQPLPQHHPLHLMQHTSSLPLTSELQDSWPCARVARHCAFHSRCKVCGNNWQYS